MPGMGLLFKATGYTGAQGQKSNMVAHFSPFLSALCSSSAQNCRDKRAGNAVADRRPREAVGPAPAEGPVQIEH